MRWGVVPHAHLVSLEVAGETLENESSVVRAAIDYKVMSIKQNKFILIIRWRLEREESARGREQL